MYLCCSWQNWECVWRRYTYLLFFRNFLCTAILIWSATIRMWRTPGMSNSLMPAGHSEQRDLTLGRTFWEICKNNFWVCDGCEWDAPVSRVVLTSPYFHESWIRRWLGSWVGEWWWRVKFCWNEFSSCLTSITSSSVWLSCDHCTLICFTGYNDDG